ncbi:MAG: L,D-transpeptidase [Eubacteriales bacterium]|nr:L,D-transpeptidase [Eubacteriales bacterium]
MSKPQSSNRSSHKSSNLIAFLIVPLGFLAFVVLVFFLLYFNDELDSRLLADTTDRERAPVSLAPTDTAPPQASQLESTTQTSRATEKTSASPSQADEKPQDSEPENPKAKDKKYWRDLDDLYTEIQDRRQNPKKYAQAISRVRVFLDEQIVVAYGLDQAGEETLLRAFPCSSGIVPGHTPLGLHSLGGKWPESWLFDNSLAQYGYQIVGNILFHSLPSYDGSLKSGLKLSDLNSMGYAASHGCIRLFCMDAKWLYENANPGCPVEILQNRGEEFQDLPEHIFYLRLKEGAPQWDPTDPDPANPYHDKKILTKWAVEEAWLQDYEVIPPVWPVINYTSPTPTDSESATRESKQEQAEETSRETLFTWPNNLMPLEPSIPTSVPTLDSPNSLSTLPSGYQNPSDQGWSYVPSSSLPDTDH